MKRICAFVVCFIILFCCTGCGFIRVVPDADTIGQSKAFEKDGIKLLLTDAYEEQVSERGFYGYYVAEFGAVMVERIRHSESSEYDGMTLEEFAERYKNDNGHAKTALQYEDGLVYYPKEEGNRTYYTFFYSGSDSFWTVQLACYTTDLIVLKDTIMLFAAAVEVE